MPQLSRPKWPQSHDGVHKVFGIALWDDTVDAQKAVVPAASRHMKDNTVFYLHVARNLLVNLKISAVGGRHHLIEPRRGALIRVRRRPGLPDLKALERAVLGR